MWIDDWQKSGKKAWTYAKENGLIPQTFVICRNKNKNRHPVTTIRDSVIEKGVLKIRLPGGMNGRDIILVIESLRAAV
jgi:hypothetical protein